MGDCIHDFVSRAGAVARGDCFACVRARLEEKERERDALRLALVEVTDQHAKRRGEVLAAQMVEKAAQDRAEAAEREREALFIEEREMYQKWRASSDRADAAERNMDTWRDQAQQIHNERSALQAQLAGVIRERDHARERQASNAQQTKDERHLRAVAEAALEKARVLLAKTSTRTLADEETLCWCDYNVESQGQPHGRFCLEAGAFLAPPTEPLRTPECGHGVTGPCQFCWAMAHHHEGCRKRIYDPQSSPSDCGAGAEPDAPGMPWHKPASDPLRTEGAPKQCESRSQSDLCALRRGHPGRHQVESGAVTWDDSCAEGAPKQEEPDWHDAFQRCADDRAVERREMESLRAQVERLEKALRDMNLLARNRDLDWDRLHRDESKALVQGLRGRIFDAFNAALAPEAPVEKEGGA